jgi:dynactin-4
VSKVYSVPDEVQSEFDAIKEHLEGYIVQSAPPATSTGGMGHRRAPSRNIAQITQAARGALRRGLGAPPRPSVRRKPSDKADTKSGWDEMKPYQAKSTWRGVAVERGLSDVEYMAEMTGEGVAPLEKRWTSSWEPPRSSK